MLELSMSTTPDLARFTKARSVHVHKTKTKTCHLHQHQALQSCPPSRDWTPPSGIRQPEEAEWRRLVVSFNNTPRHVNRAQGGAAVYSTTWCC
ncbi:hypothetical protein C0Q70_03193 [Pomacea canaliculata]|uniref:Uncharacterized protein n=1 Tax=Pomacea canaliculata TaxID=400727 RepID=A0A2T7PS59_POMCA|nr:hypothetical protein C0Q70_03193 [Pomacea canaliculata]